MFRKKEKIGSKKKNKIVEKKLFKEKKKKKRKKYWRKNVDVKHVRWVIAPIWIQLKWSIKMELQKTKQNYNNTRMATTFVRLRNFLRKWSHFNEVILRRIILHRQILLSNLYHFSLFYHNIAFNHVNCNFTIFSIFILFLEFYSRIRYRFNTREYIFRS